MKKVVSDLTTLAHKGCKIAVQKVVSFFGEFCLTSKNFVVLVLQSAWVERFFVSRMRDFSDTWRRGLGIF